MRKVLSTIRFAKAVLRLFLADIEEFSRETNKFKQFLWLMKMLPTVFRTGYEISPRR